VTRNANYEKGSGVKINTGGSVENCTIVNNLKYTAVYVGASGGTLKNCIIYSNTSGNWSNANPSTASYTNCCTTPTNDLPGSGNITNNPAFVNSGAGDYHLVANSPCINQGLNQAWMTDALDFDGKRRVDKYSGRVDMGCYEFLLRGTLFGFH